MRLTERTVNTLTTDGAPVVFRDDRLPGFGVQVTRAGRRTYVVRYVAPDGRRKQAILARVGQIPLAEARRQAGELLVAARRGDADPLEDRRQRREAPTVEELVRRFFDEHCPARVALGRMAPRTVVEYRKQASRYILPALGKYKVAAVNRRQVERMLAGTGAALVQRNRTMALTRRLFNLAETWDWRPQYSNPCRGIERAREEARDRVLSSSELGRLSAALADLEPKYPFATAAIRTAALTGLRASECLSLEWGNVSFETARATLPRTKTGRRTIPLAAPVLDLLASLPRITGNPHVFAGGRGAAVGYKLTRRVFAEAVSRAGLDNVRLHDLRRSLATSLAATGISPFALRDVLGHSTLTMSNRYVRAASDALTEAAERGAAIAAAAMAKGSGGEVVTLRPERRHG